MNREIEFRGKRKDNNEWVYGSLLILESGYYIVPTGTYYNLMYDDAIKENLNCIWEEQDFFEVLPKTIGQYTELNNKNGKKIFEGDIVKISYLYEDNIYNGAIKFGEFSYSHCDEYECKHYGWFIDCSNESYCSNTGFDLYFAANKCEIIGTIFDKEDNNE